MYDWRTRFNMSVKEIGYEMPYLEALQQAETLMSDPSSRLGAAVAGWNYPVDRSTLVLMDMFDLTLQIAWGQGGSKGRKPKPYPRPWPELSNTKTKPDADITQEQIVAALRFAGHTAELPAA